MSKTKTINTVSPVKVAGMEVGSIMQDEAGYFYRPKGTSGLHNAKRDGEHRASIEAVKPDLPPGATTPPVKAPQERKGPSSKAAPQGQKPQQAKPQEAPQKAAQAKATPQATQSPQAKPQESQKASPAAQAKPVTPGEVVKSFVRDSLERIAEERKAQGPGNASKVRYKVVEANGPMGLHLWLYAGYEHARGFKWNGSGGFMFLNTEALETFLRANGIGGTIEVETVDVTNGNYDPNKGVIPNDEPNGQRNLL